MVYANYAGTSWPKPACVDRAIARAASAPPDAWGDIYASAHAQVCRTLDLDDPSRFLFTSGATAALRLVMTSLPWRPQDGLAISALEHHALSGPAFGLARGRGVEVFVTPYQPDSVINLEALEAFLSAHPVRLVAMTMASNVTGDILPIPEVCALARHYGALSLIDGAQLMGVTSIDPAALGADFFVFAGHKGPHGPHGIGGLWIRDGVDLPAATTSPAAHRALPVAMEDAPGFCDVGSVNVMGMAGVEAGLGWLDDQPTSILEQTQPLVDDLIGELRTLDGVRIVGRTAPQCVPIVSIVHTTHTPAAMAADLKGRGIFTSGGVQCAPLAHARLGTGDEGTLRMSLGAASSRSDVDALVHHMRHIIES